MVSFEASEFLLHFLVALGLGTLIGIEREHRRDEVVVIAGVRTFPLFSLAGYMLGVLSVESESPLVLATGALIAAGTAIAFFLVRHRLGIHGLTTPAAMIVTFLLGALISYDLVMEAVVIGVATTVLLLTKGRLHQFAERLSDAEIMSTLQFVTVVFILFPLVAALPPGPLHPAAPWLGRGGIVDPYQVLLVVVFVASISFASFLAMRFVGPRRGFEVSGLLGGLVNSEATSISLAHRASESTGLVGVATVGVLLATATMFVRNLVIIAFASGGAAGVVLPWVLPVAIAGAIAAAGTAFVLRRTAREEAQAVGRIDVRNPFAVVEALKFAALFAILAAVASLASSRFGEFGVYATALGGFAYAGAVVASLGALAATGTVDANVAAIAAGLAMLAGAANKLFLLRHESRAVQARVLVPILLTLAAGGVALVATILLR